MNEQQNSSADQQLAKVSAPPEGNFDFGRECIQFGLTPTPDSLPLTNPREGRKGPLHDKRGNKGGFGA